PQVWFVTEYRSWSDQYALLRRPKGHPRSLTNLSFENDTWTMDGKTELDWPFLSDEEHFLLDAYEIARLIKSQLWEEHSETTWRLSFQTENCLIKQVADALRSETFTKPGS